MREIKFRVWNTNLKRWVHPTYQITNCIPSSEANKPMQYTGLKDKNGKEIYESDILSTPAGNGYVEYSKGVYWLHWNKKDSTTLFDCSLEVLEVIGNIFENDDLL